MCDEQTNAQNVTSTASNGSVSVGGNVHGGVTIHNHYANARRVKVDPADLAAAQKRLAELPLETDGEAPRPAILPEGSRILHRANRFFTGRQAEFRWMAACLQAGEVVALTGIGGLGKTQLAAEFALRYGRYFAGGVFWVSLAQPDNVKAEVAECGALMGLDPEYPKLTLDEQVRWTLGAWQTALPRLLIFDNCESEALLTQWLPPQGGCRVLLTSQVAAWESVAQVSALTTLPRAESVGLLQQFRPDLQAAPALAHLAAIAAALGDLPLALHLAGSYLKRYRHSALGDPARYLQALQDPALLAHPSLQGQGAGFSPTQHELNVWRTFWLSYARLTDTPEDALARTALAHAACFAEGVPIARAVLKQTLAAAETEAHKEDALQRLNGIGLMTIDEKSGALILHRLVVAFVRQVMPNTGQVPNALAEAAFAALEAAWPNQQNTLRAWGPHLRWLADAVAPRNDKPRCDLYDYAALYLHELGEFQTAATVQRQALELWKVADPTQRSTDYASAANNLANTLRTLGEYQAALALHQDALAIFQAALGAEDGMVAIIYDNLGQDWFKLGHYTEAAEAHARALVIDRALWAAGVGDVRAVASDLHNLADAQLGQGAVEVARAHYAEMLTLAGAQYPTEAARAHNGLARCALAQGDFATAHTGALTALALDEKEFGPHHLYVAFDLRELYKAQCGLGQATAAEATGQRALMILAQRLGEQHPETVALQETLQ